MSKQNALTDRHALISTKLWEIPWCRVATAVNVTLELRQTEAFLKLILYQFR